VAEDLVEASARGPLHVKGLDVVDEMQIFVGGRSHEWNPARCPAHTHERAFIHFAVVCHR
jgi:hypothetical protein